MEWIPDIATDNTSKLNVRWNAIQKGLLFFPILPISIFSHPNLGPTKKPRNGIESEKRIAETILNFHFFFVDMNLWNFDIDLMIDFAAIIISSFWLRHTVI